MELAKPANVNRQRAATDALYLVAVVLGGTTIEGSPFAAGVFLVCDPGARFSWEGGERCCAAARDRCARAASAASST